MNKIYLDQDEEIYYVENFIDEDALNIILSAYKDDSKWERSGEFYQLHDKDFPIEVKEELDKIRIKIKEIIDNDDEVANFVYSLQKFKISDHDWAIKPHSDRWTPEEDSEYGDPHANPTSSFVTKGYVLYFNDEYEGGELVYTNKDIKFRPKKKMLVVHSGFESCQHGVLSVTSGERYMMTGFVYEKINWEDVYK